ncbi:hypothetical protein LWI29_036061 [Acer saccharum]|uniref:Uncharacterized protein n=1 Tax=Acer saccharum TaxID=4024 RepID=A0AA39VU91_ACESA|nr:hypothetical protein LWI29_036061 [Acer saccharum]
MVAAAANPVWLTFPCQGTHSKTHFTFSSLIELVLMGFIPGLSGRTPGLQFHRGNKQMVQTRKARPATISALFELKPPPYPLVNMNETFFLDLEMLQFGE